MKSIFLLPAALLTGVLAVSCKPSGSSGGSSKPATELLNVSYDPTRELYGEFKKYADVHGLKYTVPDEVLEAIKETTAV